MGFTFLDVPAAFKRRLIKYGIRLIAGSLVLKSTPAARYSPGYLFEHCCSFFLAELFGTATAISTLCIRGAFSFNSFSISSQVNF